MKKTAGFTLVELIVVIAILAILAGIAIPVYSGYIAKAKEAADYQILDSVKTAALFAVMDKDPEATVEEIAITGGNTVAVTADPETVTVTADEVTNYCGPIALDYIVAATWNQDDGWEVTATVND